MYNRSDPNSRFLPSVPLRVLLPVLLRLRAMREGETFWPLRGRRLATTRAICLRRAAVVAQLAPTAVCLPIVPRAPHSS